MKNPTCQAHRMMRARAAGMASATKGRARTFAVRNEIDDSADQIAEALADREANDRRDHQQLAEDYAGLS